jgi:hypothetical protein
MTASDLTKGLFSPIFASLGVGLLIFTRSMCGQMTILNAILSQNQQPQPSINLWLRILGEYLRDPHILPAGISGCDYLKFILTQLSGLLEDVSCKTNTTVLYTLQYWSASMAAQKLSWTSDWFRTWSFSFLASMLTSLQTSVGSSGTKTSWRICFYKNR